MNYELGNKIRLLRLSKGMTQEQLADRLCVTPQTISKWENNVTAPDISMLPQISVLMGVTIDELFSITDEAKLQRIENLLSSTSDSTLIPQDDFRSYKEFLASHKNDEKLGTRILSALAGLYLQQARGLRFAASKYALEVVHLSPNDKYAHSLLREALNGVDRDWYSSNNSRLIDIYKDHVEAHPDCAPAYQLLLDNLLADCRIDEAEATLARFSRFDDSCRSLWYKAQIYLLKGENSAAENCLAEMLERFPEDWLAWAYCGDLRARHADFNAAVECYQRSTELQPSPKYIDNYLCIANISVIQKHYRTAAEYYAKTVELLKTDWNTTEGSAVEQYKALAEKYRNT